MQKDEGKTGNKIEIMSMFSYRFVLFLLSSKVENYSYDKDNFHIEGIKIINGEILQEWSQEIPEEDGGPIIDDFPRI